MCGIAGIFNPHGLPNQFKEKERIKEMTRLLHNRGPDEKGALFSNIACLGHSRLSIIDLSTGSQPMCTADNQIAIVFNGEIFNYIELRQELKSKDHSFRTNSDTEVLLELYREYGTEMLQKLNGQFVFAIIDYVNRRLFTARDRIGIRPFYYTFVGDNILFASSIKALTKNPEVEREFNPAAFHELVNFWTTYGETTFIKNIYSLSPGESLIYDQRLKKKSIYWDLQFPDHPTELSQEAWQDRIYSELNKATALRLRSDVPVNSYLSGGIDSSIILKLIQKHHPINLESFSVRFNEKFFDESRYQKLMTEDTGIKNNYIQIAPDMIGDNFDQVIFHCEQPIFRTAPTPLFYLSNLVNGKNYKVVLTGEGADEVAWGYNIYKETLIRSHLCTNPNDEKWLSRVCELNAHLPQYTKRYEKFLIDFYNKSLNNPSSPFFSHQIRMGNGKNILKFLQPEVKEQVLANNCEEEISAKLSKDFNRWNPLQKAQYLEMKTLLAGYLLSSQGDRMSMSHSVEGRYPFLDHNVVETFTEVPDALKLHEMEEKYLLKQTFGTILPKEITQRHKYPYRAPEGVSMLHPKIQESFLNETVNEKHNFFNWKYVDRLTKKIETTAQSAFVDNSTLVIITSTLMFLEMLESNFNFDSYTVTDSEFNEVELSV